MYVTEEDWNVNLEPKLYLEVYLDGQIESINSAAADADYSVLGMTLAKEDLILLPHHTHLLPHRAFLISLLLPCYMCFCSIN